MLEAQVAGHAFDGELGACHGMNHGERAVDHVAGGKDTGHGGHAVLIDRKKAASDILAVPLIGILPDDEQVVIATNQGEPLAGKPGLCGQAYLNICHRLLGEEVPFQDLDVKKGILGRLFGR